MRSHRKFTPFWFHLKKNILHISECGLVLKSKDYLDLMNTRISKMLHGHLTFQDVLLRDSPLLSLALLTMITSSWVSVTCSSLLSSAAVFIDCGCFSYKSSKAKYFWSPGNGLIKTPNRCILCVFFIQLYFLLNRLECCLFCARSI